MQPYVIKQGDYLAKLAYKFGFDADTVWNDPKNADLRQARPDPNVLWPTDILYIPDQIDKQPVTQSLTIGVINTFISQAPTVTVTIRFTDHALASQAYSVRELPDMSGLTTSGDGTATLAIPVTLETFTLEFAQSGTNFEVQVGYVDPIDTLTGVFQRLQNLGYVESGTELDPANLNRVRAMLRAMNGDTDDGSGGGATAAESSQLASSSNSATASEGGSDMGYSPQATTDAPDGPQPGGEFASGESLDGALPPVQVSSMTPQDSGGLTEDGVPDEATTKMLATAHGC